MDYIMHYDLQFNRKINPDKDFISAGGYEIVSNEKKYAFDFEKYYARIDEKDKTRLHVWHKNLDIECFPEAKKIVPEILSKIDEFSEFYLDFNAENLRVVGVQNMYFEIVGDERKIHISEKVCKKIEVY